MTFFPKVYLDTNIFVGIFEDRSSIGDNFKSLVLRHERQGSPRFLTSELAFSELLVRPYRDGDSELAQLYLDLSLGSYWLEVRPVTFAVLNAASSLRARQGSLKLPDAVHLATASQCMCSHFLTADRGIAQPASTPPNFPGGNLMTPDILRPDLPTLSAILEDLAR